MSGMVPTFGMSDQMIAALAPARAAITEQAIAATRDWWTKKITRVAVAVDREQGGGYRNGIRTIVQDGLGVDPDKVRGLSYTDGSGGCDNGTCHCASCCQCDQDDDDGDE